MNLMRTPRQQADYLQVSESTLAHMRREDRSGPPWVRIGGQIRYPDDETEKWLKEQTELSSSRKARR